MDSLSRTVAHPRPYPADTTSRQGPSAHGSPHYTHTRNLEPSPVARRGSSCTGTGHRESLLMALATLASAEDVLEECSADQCQQLPLVASSAFSAELLRVTTDRRSRHRQLDSHLLDCRALNVESQHCLLASSQLEPASKTRQPLRTRVPLRSHWRPYTHLPCPG
jgi:hypothetical protein